MIGGTCMSLSSMQRATRMMLDRVPAADAKVSQSAMDETFLLSNIAPQVGDGFNRHCMSLVTF